MNSRDIFVKTDMTNTSATLDTFFLALGDPTRLRLLNLMSAGEICVCFFVEVLDEPQPKISRHLAFLRRAGLVKARRDAKWMHYSIVVPDQPSIRLVLESVLEALRLDPAMQRDRARLEKACCSTKAPDLLKRAPKPGFLSGR